jgi:hypothetical protein
LLYYSNFCIHINDKITRVVRTDQLPKRLKKKKMTLGNRELLSSSLENFEQAKRKGKISIKLKLKKKKKKKKKKHKKPKDRKFKEK